MEGASWIPKTEPGETLGQAPRGGFGVNLFISLGPHAVIYRLTTVTDLTWDQNELNLRTAFWISSWVDVVVGRW